MKIEASIPTFCWMRFEVPIDVFILIGNFYSKISKIKNVEIYLNGGKSKEDAKIVIIKEPK